MKDYKLYKGIAYFQHFRDAKACALEVGGRVVDYQRGWAVQYYLSGPYWPELQNSEPES